MDNVKTFLTVLSKYPDFTLIPEVTNSIHVVLKYKKSLNVSVFLLSDDYECNNQMPLFALRNSSINYPHIMLNKEKILGTDYRSICLFQNDYYIFSAMSFVDKVKFSLDSFVTLINLNKKQIEVEYQKEFLYYWNLDVIEFMTVQTYISDCDHFKHLNVYKNRKSRNLFRISDKEIYFNDRKKWKESIKDAIYIPIQNSSGIIPNFSGNSWSRTDLKYIFLNHEIDIISKETYKTLSKISVRSDIIIVFSMKTPNKRIQFACRLIFNSRQEGLLFDKIESDLKEIKNIKINYHDFKSLCESIGNNADFSDDKIGIVGMGSLGSYVAEELINAGASNITIFDKDYFENTNLLRHRLSGSAIGDSKVIGMKRNLNDKHPQVNVDCYEEFLTKDNIEERVRTSGISYLIITVGSTDVQIELENKLNQLEENIVVIYVWLEIDGVNSKVLVTKNSDVSCFRDYVSQDSDVRGRTDFVLFDGCGGTRVKYGNRTLLTATNALLHAFENINDYPTPFIISANVTDGLKISSIGGIREKIQYQIKENT